MLIVVKLALPYAVTLTLLQSAFLLMHIQGTHIKLTDSHKYSSLLFFFQPLRQYSTHFPLSSAAKL